MTFPKCPHCGYEFDDEDIWHTGSTDFPAEADGDTNDTNCLSCNKPVRIMLSLSPSWIFLDENDDEISYRKKGEG